MKSKFILLCLAVLLAACSAPIGDDIRQTAIAFCLADPAQCETLQAELQTAVVGTSVILSQTPTPTATPTETATPTASATSTATLTPTRTPTPTLASPVRLAWFYKPPSNVSIQTVALGYDEFILTNKDEPQRDQLKATNPNAKVLQYLSFYQIHDPGNCTAIPRGNQAAYKAGDFCDISTNHPDWFLLNAQGQRILEVGSPPYYLMKLDSPGWQAFFTSRANEMSGSPLNWTDGIFLDNWLQGRYGQSAVVSFFSYFKTHYTGPKVFANYQGLVGHETGVYDQFVDGSMYECFALDCAGSYRTVASWGANMTRIDSMLSQNKSLILVSHGTQADAVRETFALASYLLVAGDGVSFRYVASSAYNQHWPYANYDSALGQATGPRFQNGENTWQRNFTNGTVIVNPLSGIGSIVVGLSPTPLPTLTATIASTATISPSVTATATLPASPTASLSPVPPTATRIVSNTPVEDTVTSVPTNTVVTSTSTLQATDTQISPSATPTATPAPPAATKTATAANTPTNAPTVTQATGQPTAPPTVAPQAGAVCPDWLHASQTTVGPDGNPYHTWHPQRDPVSDCHYDHEHGDDPRTSLANPNMPAFGFVGLQESNPVSEPNSGFKVYVQNAGTINDEGRKAIYSTRIIVHQGTGGVARFSVQFHSLEFDLVDTANPHIYEMHVKGMGDTQGTDNICQRDIKNNDSNSSNDIGKSVQTLPNDNCPAQLNSAYELWAFALSLRSGNTERAKVIVSSAVFDPVTVFDRNNPTALLKTSDVYELWSYTHSSFAHPFKGCKREAYSGPIYFYAGGMPPTFKTDARGNITANGPLTQYVSPRNNNNFVMTNNLDPQSQFKFLVDYCPGSIGLGDKN